MDYEKLHKDTITKLQEMVNSGKITVEIARGICADFIPESEDDIIIKALKSGFKMLEREYNLKGLGGIKFEKILSWLEKQVAKVSAIEGFETEFERQVSGLIASAINKEHEYNKGYVKWTANALLNYAKHELKKQGWQEPVDTVEPKFKVGDLITNGILVGEIDEIHELGYHAYFGDHYADVPDIENWHKWTIQDAKDGDVLCCENGWTCIFKTLVNDKTFSSYCFMDITKWFCETGSECHTLKEEFAKAYNGKIYPATKEQRELLFQKMKEAGYEWDADKKELKKIELNPAWSEEDERNLQGIIDEIKANKTDAPDYDLATYDRFLSWLKFLKDRVGNFDDGYKVGFSAAKYNQWKPSEEDIADILDVTDAIANDDSMEERLKTMSEKEYCQEVLKRFKKIKGTDV